MTRHKSKLPTQLRRRELYPIVTESCMINQTDSSTLTFTWRGLCGDAVFFPGYHEIHFFY